MLARKFNQFVTSILKNVDSYWTNNEFDTKYCDGDGIIKFNLNLGDLNDVPSTRLRQIIGVRCCGENIT